MYAATPNNTNSAFFFFKLQLLQSQLQFLSADANFYCAPQALSLCPSSVRTPRIRADALFQLNLLLDVRQVLRQRATDSTFLTYSYQQAQLREGISTAHRAAVVRGLRGCSSSRHTYQQFTRLLPDQWLTESFDFARLSPPFLT